MLSLPDVNVLVALTNPSHVHHDSAHGWLAQVDRYATTPVTESGLVRLLLNPGVVGQHISPARALTVLGGVRSDGRAHFLPDDSSLADPAVDPTAMTGHRQVTDWHLLNLAVRHDAQLVTFDRRLVRALTAAGRRHVLSLT